MTRNWLTAGICALTVAVAATTGAAQMHAIDTVQVTNLSAEDLRVLAQNLLNAGDPATAAEVLKALLARDQNDPSALVMGAQAALDQSAPKAAADLAARGYRNADNDIVRYVAARLAARSHAELAQDTRAQIWLRRARQYAPDNENAASVAQDYAFIRDRNPLAVSLAFGATPSNNINNGSSSDTATIGRFETILSESAKPLSGIAFDAGGTLQYRLRHTDRAATFAELDLRTTTYALSDGAKAALRRDITKAENSVSPPDDLPSAGSDFAYSVLSAGLIERRLLREGMQATTFSLRGGQSWYGGDPYQTFISLGVAQPIDLGPTEQFQLDVNIRQDFAEDSFRDTFSYAAGGRYLRLLDSGNLASVNLSTRISKSDDSERDNRSVELGLGLDLGRPILDTQFGFEARIEKRTFDKSVYTIGIRRDWTVGAQVTAVFDNVEYFGFKPALTASIGRTFSQAERFDTQYGNFGFDLRSAF